MDYGNFVNLGNLVNLGAASAVILTVALFLKHLRKVQGASRAEREAERKESRAEREAERKTLMDIIINSLAHVEAGLAENVKILREVRSALERLNGKGR